jgi:thiol-disulfide isomerase/thioredoxin
MRRLIVTMITVGFVLILSPEVRALQEGAASPDAELRTDDGTTLTFTSLRGRFIYLDFWASWCPPCRIALPFLNELQEKFGERNLTVIAVNIDENPEDAAAALRNILPKFTAVRDEGQNLIALFDPPKMPSSFIIDPAGKIVAIHPGFTEADKSAIVSQLDSLLGGHDGRT